MKYIAILFVLCCFTGLSQTIIKIKQTDNRFAFYQKGTKNDTIIRNKSDDFYIRFPDSLKRNLQINIVNARFTQIGKDSLFRLMPINGMKYSHTLIDTSFTTLLEGNCPPSKTISIDIINTKTQKTVLKNRFTVK